jgi:glycosyltransferase involved in cell wall biosynthesis
MRSCNALTKLSRKQKLIDGIFRPILNSVATVKLAPSDLAAIYTFGEKQYRDGKVNILHNGVDLEVYRYDPEARARIREEFALGDCFVVGHVGRFSRQKNHKFLLPIFAKIKEKRTDARLLLVGTGELEAQIRTQAEELGILDDIIFTGVRSDVPALLSAMDVFVLTSLYEGMPNTVIEAQATGLPCVISDTITRQASVADIVAFLPLEQSAEIWADNALAVDRESRKDTRGDFLEAEYDIDSVRQLFVDLLYEEK